MTVHSSHKAFWIIFFVVFIDLLGFGIVFPLLPLYTRYFAMSPADIGWVLGIYSLMQFFCAPLLGRWSDRIGRRPVMLISMAGTWLSFLTLGFAKTFWIFFLARAVDGIAGSNIATAQAYIADMSPKEQRTRNLGMWTGAAFGLGFAFGPALGGGAHWVASLWFPNQPILALQMPFLLAAGLSFANWCFALTCLPESLNQRDSDHLIGSRTFSLTSLLGPLKTLIGPLIIAYAIMILAFSQMEGSFSWVANDLFHFSENTIYAVFAYLGIVMTLVQGGLVRRLSAKMGDKPLVISGMILMIIGLGCLPLIVQSWWLWLMAGTLATGHSLSQPALLSSISKASTDETQGFTMGVCQSLASLSRFMGPLLAGCLYPLVHATGVYGSAAFFMILALALALNGFRHITQAAT